MPWKSGGAASSPATWRTTGGGWHPKQPVLKWMFDKTAVFHVRIWNHPIESTSREYLFRVPGAHVLIVSLGGA